MAQADSDSVTSVSDEEFILLFTKSQFALHSFIVGVTRSMTEADDILQEVNLALWKKRLSFDGRLHFLRWAIGFAKNEIYNYRKRSAKSRLLFSNDVLNSLAEEWPCDLTYHEQRITLLAECVKKLSHEEKRYVADFYRNKTSVQELSELNHTPASTIYKILNRARLSLRKCVQFNIAQASHPPVT